MANTYRPSWRNFNKYTIYLRYFIEYIKYKDFKSTSASLKYVLTHRLPKIDYTTSSGMGKFSIRKGTTDFQFINYAYEKSIKDYFLTNINSFDVFIDVGACIGEYCIWLASLGKKCIAIEPVNYKAIEQNLLLNGLRDKVLLFKCGVGKRRERVYFFIPDGVTSSSHKVDGTDHEPNVEIETIDNIYAQFNLKPTDRIIMKLDVEGMEVDAIQGGQEFIKNCNGLRVIYEHFPEDGFRNDKALLDIGNFAIEDIDAVNRIAMKI